MNYRIDMFDASRAALRPELRLQNGWYFEFECDPKDIDTAYDAVLESIVPMGNDQKEAEESLTELEDMPDDSVETMLNGMQAAGFISDWEEE